MATKKRPKNRQHPLGDPMEGFTHTYEIKIGARVIPTGTEVKIHNRRGNFLFLRIVTREDGVQWVDLRNPYGQFVAVRPELITKVAPKRRGRQ